MPYIEMTFHEEVAINIHQHNTAYQSELYNKYSIVFFLFLSFSQRESW